MDENADLPAWAPALLEKILTGATVEDIVIALRDGIGVEHVVYHSSHLGASPSSDPFIRLTYPASWIKRYLQMGYINVDPVLRDGFRRTLPFFWDEVEISTANEVKMLADAISYGVGPLGYSVPIRSKRGHRGLFSMSSSGDPDNWRALCLQNAGALVEIASKLHNRVLREEFGDEKLHLSTRELECLSWTANGKDAGEISSILDISPHTVRDYLKSVRHKLDCVTLAQAVSKAMHLGLLN